MQLLGQSIGDGLEVSGFEKSKEKKMAEGKMASLQFWLKTDPSAV